MPTTNNNWPTPVASDLVKDGWEAIKDLGDAIDTTLGVYAPPATGLTLINTTSFSGVASQSFDDLFTSSYKNYRIELSIDAVGNATDNITFRFRTATSPADITLANYRIARFISNYSNSGSAASGATGQTSGFNLEECDIKLSMDIFNPFETLLTSYNFLATNSASVYYGGGQYNATTSIGGLTFITTGTLTGVMSCYGYNA
jgi:hypothetical protein